MDALMFGDGHVILEPRTVTLGRLDWEEVYAQLTVAARDWETLALYATGDWRSYCVTRGREAERLADALNEQLSLKGDR